MAAWQWQSFTVSSVFSYTVATGRLGSLKPRLTFGLEATGRAVPSFSGFNTVLGDVKNHAMAKLRAWLLQFGHLIVLGLPNY